MAVSVDWGTSVVTVPKADLTLIQASPTEIRELNLTTFYRELHGLQASEDGQPFPPIFQHNTEVSLGGLTYARVIEILAPYTITFEDGQYAVNLVGANSNVGDRVNVNQVSVRSQNSAGLISTPLIEVASFENGVSWDPENSTGKAVADTSASLAGSRNVPLINLSDVAIVAAARKFNTVYVLSDNNTLTSGDFDRFIFRGQAHVNNTITVEPAADVLNSTFYELRITGTLDGGNQIDNSAVEDLIYFNGHIHNCDLIGDIQLAGSVDAVMADCRTIDPYDPPVIDMGGSGQNLAMPNYAGLVTIRNMTGSNFVGIGLNAGQVTIDSGSVTAGIVHISGVGEVTDEFGATISSGTWNGGVMVINTTVSGQALDDLHRVAGLNPDQPMTVTDTARNAGDISQTIDDDGTTTTVTRT